MQKDVQKYFSEAEILTAKELLVAHFKADIKIHLADTELRLTPDSNATRKFPTLFWQARNCGFAVLKLAENEFQSQFFYNENEPFGAGQHSFSDLENCVSILLQRQSEHEHENVKLH